ncbi:MAG TPA: response regulator [Actinomycetota bacterium]|nr:response regulator [Actinomycetota bacterium]
MSDQAKPRILIVDDDPVIVRLLQVNFRLDGYDVETAARGDEAIAKMRERRPDAVLLDVMMPGLDGWEVCARMKDDPNLADVAVVFLSARAQDEDRERGQALGVLAYVTKPFDPAQLVVDLRGWLAER